MKLSKSEKETMRKMQRAGGLAKKKKYPNSFSEMGKKGAEKRWGKKEPLENNL